MLFFVHTEEAMAAAAEAPGSREALPPLFVRRASLKQPQLPPDLQWEGAACGLVDWRASLLLNIVLQTGFCLVRTWAGLPGELVSMVCSDS